MLSGANHTLKSGTGYDRTQSTNMAYDDAFYFGQDVKMLISPHGIYGLLIRCSHNVLMVAARQL